jgi:hypothetical protein
MNHEALQARPTLNTHGYGQISSASSTRNTPVRGDRILPSAGKEAAAYHRLILSDVVSIAGSR